MARVTVILPEEMTAEVDKEAQRLRVSRSAVIRWAWEKYLKELEESK